MCRQTLLFRYKINFQKQWYCNAGQRGTNVQCAVLKSCLFKLHTALFKCIMALNKKATLNRFGVESMKKGHSAYLGYALVLTAQVKQALSWHTA